MSYIVLADPTIGSENLGDYIIKDAVLSILKRSFPDSQIVELPTQLALCKKAHKLILAADKVIIGGTNLLRSDMYKRSRQWKLDLYDYLKIKNKFILLGVGWWQYQDNASWYTKKLYERVLSTASLHSVRDSYTKDQLSNLGINNVVNTGCPTMWGLNGLIPQIRKPKKRVVFTLTNYKVDVVADKRLLEELADVYEEIWFWPQNYSDLRYLESIGSGFEYSLLKPTCSSLDRFLEENECDYVGTRLHAGVRAIQKGRKSLIIAVDNRALEIGKDTNLPVISRELLENGILNTVFSGAQEPILMPESAIEAWLEQFN